MRVALRDGSAWGGLVNLHSPAAPLLSLCALWAVLALPGRAALLRRRSHRDPERWAHRNVHHHDDRSRASKERDP